MAMSPRKKWVKRVIKGVNVLRNKES